MTTPVLVGAKAIIANQIVGTVRYEATDVAVSNVVSTFPGTTIGIQVDASENTVHEITIGGAPFKSLVVVPQTEGGNGLVTLHYTSVDPTTGVVHVYPGLSGGAQPTSGTYSVFFLATR